MDTVRAAFSVLVEAMIDHAPRDDPHSHLLWLCVRTTLLLYDTKGVCLDPEQQTKGKVNPPYPHCFVVQG